VKKQNNLLVIVVIALILLSIRLYYGVKFLIKKNNKLEQKSDRYRSLFMMMCSWVRIKQDGKSICSYFNRHKYKNIAIYGMSHVGELLLDELKDSDVKVAYGIDRNRSYNYIDIDVCSPEDSLKEVDAIVVTAITSFDEIKSKLSTKVSCPIISLEKILFEV
jgi:lactate dehydrogenase-like 2-hydroxyacid dehydrogenase